MNEIHRRYKNIQKDDYEMPVKESEEKPKEEDKLEIKNLLEAMSKRELN